MDTILARRTYWPVIALSAALWIASSSHLAAQPLPTGWLLTDIGLPLISGSATFSNGAFSLSATTANVVDTADQFTFAYDQVDGDTVFSGRVASFSGTGTGAEAGLMIRESILPGSKQVSIFLTSDNTLVMTSRSTADGSRVVLAVSAGAVAPVWLRLERSSSTITAFQSADGITWTSVGAANVTMTTTVYAGMAAAGGTTASLLTTTGSDLRSTPLRETAATTGTTTTSTTSARFDKVNHSPRVSMTAPAGGSTYSAPATISVAATARDNDGTVVNVDFYANGTLIGSDTTSPYSISWSSVPAGTYTLTALGTDDMGATTTSAAVSITVTAAANQAPSVSLTAPANGSTYTAPATVTVSASASDTDGTVAKVDFYAGATLIGSDATSPYSISWSNVQAGTYTLTARATDDKGATTTSAGLSITAAAPNQPPTASLTSPADGATFTAPATMTLSATASDSDGTITSVEFYSGSTLLGSDTTSPYSIPWSNVQAGSYSLTAVARDNANGTTVSGARSITVMDPNTPTTADFTPSADNDTSVTYYEVEIYPQGANPGSANPVGAQDIGKPAVVNGECRADIHTMILSLSPGTYFGTVTAFGANGSARSVPSPLFTR